MNASTAIEYLLVFIGFLGGSLLINWFILRFYGAKAVKKNSIEKIRWTQVSKPFLGGISFFLLFVLALVLFFLFYKRSVLIDLQFVGIVTASVIGFFSGLSDDFYHSNPYSKISFQLLTAIVLIISGTYISIFPWDWLNYIFTILWVVGLMNSINMFDNMDAIASVATLFSILAILITILITNRTSSGHFFVLIALSASLVGFLFYNWNPSKMYMGDNGSQFLGACMAAFSIIYLWNFKVGKEGSVSIRILLPLLAFLLPICDTIIVSINRLARGQSPFVGGKDHTSHHLSYMGLSDRAIAIIFAFISILCMLGVLICSTFEIWTANLSIAFFSFSITILLLLFLVTKRKSNTIFHKK